MAEENLTERWENSSIDLIRVNKELVFKLSILTDVPYSFYNKKDKDRFGLRLTYKTFINLHYNTYDEKRSSNGCSVSFTTEQFIDFSMFLEEVYNSFFKMNGINDDGTPNYKHFVYNKNDNRFQVKTVSMNIKKRFANTCLRRNIDFMLGTSDMEETPKVGVLVIFSENFFSFVKRTDFKKMIYYFKTFNVTQAGLSLFNASYGILKNPEVEARPKPDEKMEAKIEESKIKMMASKKELKEYCIQNKIDFSEEDFRENDLNTIKNAVIDYIHGE